MAKGSKPRDGATTQPNLAKEELPSARLRMHAASRGLRRRE